MKILLLVCSIYLFSATSCSQKNSYSSLEPAEWLIGSWQGTYNGQPFYEAWKKVNDSLMVNFSIQIKAEDTLIQENGFIRYNKRKVIYGSEGAVWEIIKLEKDKIIVSNDTLKSGRKIIWTHTKNNHWLAEIHNSNGIINYDLIKVPKLDDVVDDYIKAIQKRQSHPFSIQELNFRNDSTTLKGSLYIPAGKGTFPAVIFLHGSGQSTRANFRFYAEYLATNGFAVLIYDKRNIGNVPATELVTGDQLAGDALAGVQILKHHPQINVNKVGLIGGSQGAGIAAKAVAKSKDINFLVAFSAGGVSYEELSIYQYQNRLRERNFTEKDIGDAITAVQKLYNYVRNPVDKPSAQKMLDSAWLHPWARIVFASDKLPTNEEIKTWVQFRELDNTPLNDWKKVAIPVLLVWGENDKVVPVEISKQRIATALKNNNDVTMQVIKDADHSLIVQENSQNQPTIQFMKLLLNWLNEKVK